MVTTFPDLLNYALFAPFIIRLFLGVYFILWGLSFVQKKIENETTGNALAKKAVGLLGLVGGLFVVAGFLTQIAALVLAALSLYLSRHTTNRLQHILFCGMAVSLLFSGAGFFAFDLPL